MKLVYGVEKVSIANVREMYDNIEGWYVFFSKVKFFEQSRQKNS